MKEYNTGVLFEDQKDEKVWNTDEGKEKYKGKELTMTKDTLKINKCALEKFQIIELEINQEYLEDKTIEEKDDDRLKLNEEEMHTEDGNVQQSKF